MNVPKSAILIVLFLASCGHHYKPDSATFSDTSGRQRVECSQFRSGAAVIVAFGQSMASNESDPAAIYVPSPAVANFDFVDGHCYRARDPLLGATGHGSNYLSRLGDKLVSRGIYKRVLLVPFAHSGSSVANWAPHGDYHVKLTRTLSLLGEEGLKPTAIIWQQGEADSHNMFNEAAYRTNFAAVVKTIRDAGVGAPIYIAQSTVCGNDPDPRLERVQRELAHEIPGAREGADTDLIGPDGRVNGCHFNLSGLERASDLWFAALTAR